VPKELARDCGSHNVDHGVKTTTVEAELEAAGEVLGEV
jgi:hypothetical protein